MPTSICIDSRFPNMVTTIFTTMPKMAAECGAVNLSQGFPSFQAEPALFDAMHRHMQAGRNQYVPMAGVPELRTAMVDKVAALYDTRFDVESEVMVTAGATQAIFNAQRGSKTFLFFVPLFPGFPSSSKPEIRLTSRRLRNLPGFGRSIRSSALAGIVADAQPRANRFGESLASNRHAQLQRLANVSRRFVIQLRTKQAPVSRLPIRVIRAQLPIEEMRRQAVIVQSQPVGPIA